MFKKIIFSFTLLLLLTYSETIKYFGEYIDESKGYYSLKTLDLKEKYTQYFKVSLYFFSYSHLTLRLYANNKLCDPKEIKVEPYGYAYVFFDCSKALNEKLNSLSIYSNDTIRNVLIEYEVEQETKISKGIKAMMHGTEYVPNDNAKLFVMLIDDYGNPITNASCFLTTYYPNNTKLFDEIPMFQIENSGIYEYSFITPNVYGVYPSYAKCSYSYLKKAYNATSFGITQGEVKGGDITKTYKIDGVVHKIHEKQKGFSIFYNFTGVTIPENATEFIIYSVYKWNFIEPINIWIYNYSSNSWKLATSCGYAPSFSSCNAILRNINMSHIIQGGKVQLKINDSYAQAEADKDFLLDFLNIEIARFYFMSFPLYGTAEVHVSRFEEAKESEYMFVFENSRVLGDIIENNLTIYSFMVYPKSLNISIYLQNGVKCTSLINITHEGKKYENYTLIWNGNRCMVVLQTKEIYMEEILNFSLYYYNNVMEESERNYIRANLMLSIINQSGICTYSENSQICERINLYAGNISYFYNLSLNDEKFEIQIHHIVALENYYNELKQEFEMLFVKDGNNKLSAIENLSKNIYLAVLEINSTLFINVSVNMSPVLLKLDEVADILLKHNQSAVEMLKSMNESIYAFNEMWLGKWSCSNMSNNTICYRLENITVNISHESIKEIWSYENRTIYISEIERIMRDDFNLKIITNTEYSPNENATVALLLKNTNGSIVEGATCWITIFYPNMSILTFNQTMNELGWGVYYYNLITPDIYGIYITYLTCEQLGYHTNSSVSFHIAEWSKKIYDIETGIDNNFTLLWLALNCNTYPNTTMCKMLSDLGRTCNVSVSTKGVVEYVFDWFSGIGLLILALLIIIAFLIIVWIGLNVLMG